MIRHFAAALCLAFAMDAASATIASAQGASDKMNDRMERMTKRFERLDKNNELMTRRADELGYSVVWAADGRTLVDGSSVASCLA